MFTAVQSATREEDQGGLQLRVDHHGGHHGSTGDGQDGRDGGGGEVHHEGDECTLLNFNLNLKTRFSNCNKNNVIHGF